MTARCPWCGGKRFYRKTKRDVYGVAIYQCLHCKRDFYGDIRRHSVLGLYGPTWRPVDSAPERYVDSYLADNMPYIYRFKHGV